MNRKIISVLLALVVLAGLLSACGGDEYDYLKNLPVATHNPAISKPEGQYYTANGELFAEGGVVTLGADFMRLMIEGKEVEFALSEKVQKDISIYNKDKKNLRIMRGTMLQVTYTKKDLIWVAETIGILQAN